MYRFVRFNGEGRATRVISDAHPHSFSFTFSSLVLSGFSLTTGTAATTKVPLLAESVTTATIRRANSAVRGRDTVTPGKMTVGYGIGTMGSLGMAVAEEQQENGRN